MRLILWLLKHRSSRVVTQVLILLGVEIPASVDIGDGLLLHHRARGLVVTPHASIGRNVQIYQHVTIGRADAYVKSPALPSDCKFVTVGDGCVLLPGCVVVGSPSYPVNVGRGCVIAANAVLTTSTGENEIWGGVPAKKISDR